MIVKVTAGDPEMYRKYTERTPPTICTLSEAEVALSGLSHEAMPWMGGRRCSEKERSLAFGEHRDHPFCIAVVLGTRVLVLEKQLQLGRHTWHTRIRLEHSIPGPRNRLVSTIDPGFIRPFSDREVEHPEFVG
ncbi:MAG: hypothetical protein ACRDVL_05020 [Acidimicrobiia bacterium]